MVFCVLGFVSTGGLFEEELATIQNLGSQFHQGSRLVTVVEKEAKIDVEPEYNLF